jgi:predicted peptidase
MNPALEARTLRSSPGGDESLSYLLYRPDRTGDPDDTRRWPLVLFLHGAGERGDDPAMLVAQGLPKLAAQGTALPFYLVAPQCPLHSSWTCELTVLAALLDEILADHPVDPERVTVTGLSMGAIGTWAMAARYPDRLAGIAPICAGWLPEATPRMRDLAVWAFHGEDDTVMPIAQTEQMVAALRSHDANVRFTRYPGVGHDSWVPAYEESDVCAWLAGRRRSSRRDAPTHS